MSSSTCCMSWPLCEHVPPALTDYQQALLDKGKCPQCGSDVARGYTEAFGNPGDVEPTAHCKNPGCDWGY